MNLDDAQKSRVTAWIKEGLRLSDIQKRLADELHLHLTYMEVRLLVDDLKLVPKDIEPAKTLEVGSKTVWNREAPATGAKARPAKVVQGTSAGAGRVAGVREQIPPPGTVGRRGVTFSQGNKAKLYLDQLGR